MPKTIVLKRGLDIPLCGSAEKKLNRLPMAPTYAVSPEDFPGLIPKLLVKEGDEVRAGSPLFFDKIHPDILFTSPVSGRVTAVNRGEKRRLLSVVVEADGLQQYEAFPKTDLRVATREQIASVLQRSGLWPALIRRPYGVVADPADRPKAIFVSGFDSAPLAPDLAFALEGEAEALQAGFDALGRLTDGSVHIGLRPGENGVFDRLEGVEKHYFKGPHPAGNVGVQIHHIAPLNKGEVVWTIGVEFVAMIGRLFLTGRLDMTRVIAVTGSEVINPQYYALMSGAPVSSIVRGNIRPQDKGRSVRIISGNVLTGRKTEPDGYLGYYARQVTVIPEGDRYELLGWAMPRFDKFSVSRTYFSWLFPRRCYRLDTNMNGGERPFVVTGLYEKYLPMDIHPMYLFKAILAQDIDRMEGLGIYEVVGEDVALCEFVDPSKMELQQLVHNGIDLMMKELN